MRDVVKIVAMLLALGWLATTFDTGTSPAKVPPAPKWRRTSRGWRELSGWYMPDGHFHQVPLGPISFAALECAVVVAYLVLTPPSQPARRTARSLRWRPPTRGHKHVARGTVASTTGRLSAAMRPTARHHSAASPPRHRSTSPDRRR